MIDIDTGMQQMRLALSPLNDAYWITNDEGIPVQMSGWVLFARTYMRDTFGEEGIDRVREQTIQGAAGILRAYVRQVNHWLYNSYDGSHPDDNNYNVVFAQDRANGPGMRVTNGIKIGLNEYVFEDGELAMQYSSTVYDTADAEYNLHVSGNTVSRLPSFTYGSHSVGDLVRSGRITAIIEEPVHADFIPVGSSTSAGPLHVTLDSLAQYNNMGYPLFSILEAVGIHPLNHAYYQRMTENNMSHLLDSALFVDLAQSIHNVVGQMLPDYIMGWGSSTLQLDGGTANWRSIPIPDVSTIYANGIITSISGDVITTSGIALDVHNAARYMQVGGDSYRIIGVSNDTFTVEDPAGLSIGNGAIVIDVNNIFVPGNWDNELHFNTGLGAYESSAPFMSRAQLANSLAELHDNAQMSLVLSAIGVGMYHIQEAIKSQVRLSQIEGLGCMGMFFEGGSFVGAFDGLQIT